MYHDVEALLNKLDVINEKKFELQHLLNYIESHKTIITIDINRLESQRDFLIADIQALCREIANDTGQQS